MDSPQLKTIFSEALVLRDGPERAAYLDEACRGDAGLRAQVETLLKDHERIGRFLETATGSVGSSVETAGRGPGDPQAGNITQAETPGTCAAAPAEPGAEGHGAIIGPYKLLQQIGEGGMGTVYMAEQFHPVRRKVALKVIKAGMDSRQVIARFEAERQALALMDHVNIARVLDAGATESGRPYFVMELVHGVPITQYCDANRMTPRQRLELFVPVCRAIQHAHQKGIIHRDLKPSNVMITLYDGQPVPKVIDFGVAKATEQRLTERTLFTQYGTLVGTLEYMSPEQAEMSALGVDTRSDIYSLGVLLYELLTGSTPLGRERVREAAYAEVLRMIKEDEPLRPSTRLSESGEALASISALRHTEPARLTKLVRGELDWIAMRSLEKDRNRRYETANGFAMDVQRYLDDDPVQACPPSLLYRSRKFARRNKRLLVPLALVALSLVAGMAASTWQAVRATRAEGLAQSRLAAEKKARKETDEARAKSGEERDRAVRAEGSARAEAARAKEQEVLARRRFSAAQLHLAQQALEAGNIARTLDLLETQRPKFDDEDMRTVEWYYLWQQCHRGHRLTLQGWKGETRVSNNGGSERGLAISPDGRTLAAVGWDRYVRLWDLATGRQRATLEGHSYLVNSVAFSPDGRTLATGGFDSTVLIWDVGTHRVKRKLQVGSGLLWSLAISPDGSTLVTGSANAVQLWDLTTGRAAPNLSGHEVRGQSVAFSPDGRTVVRAAGVGALKVWDVATRAERHTLDGPAPLAFAPDGTLASGRSTIRLWDVHTGEGRSIVPGSDNLNPAGYHMAWDAVCLDFSPKGNLLAWGTQDRHVMVYDLSTRQVRRHHGRLSSIQGVTFSPDGRTLASAADDGKIEVWDVEPESEPAPRKHISVRSVVFSRDGKVMASASHSTAKVVEVATGREIASIKIKADWKGAPCALSPEGTMLAAAGADGTVRLFETATGRELACVQGHKEVALSVGFSPDGKTLASGSQDGSAILWEVPSLRSRATLRVSRGCAALAFSPDGQLLATGSSPGLTTIWDVATGKERSVLQGKQTGNMYDLWGAAFSPDGTMLATAGTSGTVKLWDVQAGELRETLKGHTGRVASVAFTPDGRTLVTTVEGGDAKFWDPATGQERITIKDVYPVGVAPDGKTMAFGAFPFGPRDGEIRLWHRTEDPEARAYRTELAPDNALDPLVRLKAGDHLYASGRLEESARSYRRAIDRLEELGARNPTVPEYRAELAYCHLALGLVLGDSGRPEEADRSQRQGLEIHRKLATDHPDAPDLRTAPIDRLDVLADLVKRTPEGDRKVVQIGHQVLSIHDAVPSAAPPCVMTYRSIVAHSYQLQGDEFAAKGRHEEAKRSWGKAIDELTEVIEAGSRKPSVWAPRVDAARLAKALELQVGSSSLRIHLGNFLRDVVDVDAVIARFSAVEDTDPELAGAWVARGVSYNRRRESVKATEDFSAAIRLRPDPWYAWYGRAWAYFHMGQWDRAVADFSEAIARDPTQHTNWFHRGHSYLNLARWDKAASDFTQVIERWPADIEGWYLRGVAYAQLSRPDRALSDLRQAVAKGFKDVGRIKGDPRLDPLRSHDDFKTLLSSFEKAKE